MITGDPDLLVTKHVNSAFYGEPDLHDWLQRARIDRLVIAGITTNHCCDTTATNLHGEFASVVNTRDLLGS
jgi:nicotinamidase-related amidase